MVGAYISHELHDSALDLRWHRGRETHGLLVLGCGVEDLLHVLPHVRLLEHLVYLVDDEDLELRGIEGLVLHEHLDTARAAHNDVGLVGFKALLLLRKGDTTVDALHGDALEVGLEALELLGDLVCKLPGVHNHESLEAIIRIDALQGDSHEDSCLAHASLGLCDNVIACQAIGNRLLLNWNDQKTSKQYISSHMPHTSAPTLSQPFSAGQ